MTHRLLPSASLALLVVGAMGATSPGCEGAETSETSVGTACPPDSYRCAAGAIERCPSDGSGWTVVKTCAAGEICQETLCVDDPARGGTGSGVTPDAGTTPTFARS